MEFPDDDEEDEEEEEEDDEGARNSFTRNDGVTVVYADNSTADEEAEYLKAVKLQKAEEDKVSHTPSRD